MMVKMIVVITQTKEDAVSLIFMPYFFFLFESKFCTRPRMYIKLSIVHGSIVEG